MLLDFSGCDAVELRLNRRNKCYRSETRTGSDRPFQFDIMSCAQDDQGKVIPCSPDDSGLERLCREVARKRFDASLPFFTEKGSFFANNTENPLTPWSRGEAQRNLRGLVIGGDYKSLALIPIVVDQENMGLLQLKSKRGDYFRRDEMEFFEDVAETIGVALAYRNTQVALRERVKELTCLYGIARLVERPGISVDEIMQGIVNLLPPGWLYPDIASARIILDGRQYSTPDFREDRQRQTADIVVNGERRGVVEVAYAEERPELDEGPFLKEERSLIDTIAREVAVIIERRQAEEERFKLQDQLRHADRLATIGQLASGVAHELNEPLGNILGFVQLARKCPGLPKQAEQDIEKAVMASLHAREVIKKLMLFGRRMPPQKTQVNLNKLVEEGLYFLESRCAKEGIELVRSFVPSPPEITADPGQLTQVLVNLVVNAIQAMPQGGKLTVQTLAGEGQVSLIVEDTGVGISAEVMSKIFTPFFTTKEIDQGTGLGLSVVHGIVTSHGGSIKVDSTPGVGTRFEVKLPLTGAPDIEEND
jgi:two-component system NtrC family sensor kinase